MNCEQSVAAVVLVVDDVVLVAVGVFSVSFNTGTFFERTVFAVLHTVFQITVEAKGCFGSKMFAARLTCEILSSLSLF